MRHTLFVILAALCAAQAAIAGVKGTPHLDQRQARQAARIERGETTGALTQREATRLERGQDRVDALEADAKADGVVTRAERVHLDNAADRQSARIYRQKHDRQHDYNHNGLIDRPVQMR